MAQEMISITWTDFPITVRRRLVEYYENFKSSSVMEDVWRDHELGWMTPIDGSSHLSVLLFTPAQYTLFLLKWS